MPGFSPARRLRRILAAAAAFAARCIGRESAWDRVSTGVPAKVFGPGSHRPFAEYFRGKTTVRVESIDDIVSWLQSCDYVSDLELFQRRDVWQHPRAFERRRRGDCEDFALWAWRKLAEVGIDAEFCVGRVTCGDAEAARQHAWVVYRVDDEAFLFEPAARERSRMIRPLAEAMDDYVPHFAVDHRFETTVFNGCAAG
jgi:hypothetical protein